MDTQLTKQETAALASCKSIVERGLGTFVEVGRALAEIRDSRLYRNESVTFESFCADNWDMARTTVFQYIKAAGVVENVRNCEQSQHILPTTESQARPLTHLDPELQQEAWARAVDTAPDGKVTAKHVESVVREIDPKGPCVLGDVPPPEGKFRCIVLDPPWPVKKIERVERPKQREYLDYPTMTLEAIHDLKDQVLESADQNGCHVYLWVTHKFLPEGLRIFEHWGVNYECMMTWVKPTGMTPYSWMYNTEHVLFGRIGSLKVERMGMKLAFDAPVIGHSVKPSVFYDRVKEASPEKRLEMFARKAREGFTVWGNEVPDAI